MRAGTRRPPRRLASPRVVVGDAHRVAIALGLEPPRDELVAERAILVGERRVGGLGGAAHDETSTLRARVAREELAV